MRKYAAGGLIAVWILGLSVAMAAPKDDEDEDTPKARPGNLSGLRRWFGGDKNTPPATPEKSVARKPDALPVKGAALPAPRPVEPSAERAREQKALERRQAVCDKLREVALETGDGELQRLAEQLDERVWSLYLQRTAHLPGGKTPFEGDEKTLDKHLKPDAVTGRTPLMSPASAGRNGGSRAAAGEGKR